VFGIALGCEDLNDHDQLRHDRTQALLPGKLKARSADFAAVAGKSTLNRPASLTASVNPHLEEARQHRLEP